MSRSLKKGPYVDEKLLKKVVKLKAEKKDTAIQTWARSSQIAPEFVGRKFLVHNGRKFIEILVNESMVGHRLGEFAQTRTFKGHGRITKKVLQKT
jgi:small subunit ribosomal protein S19